MTTVKTRLRKTFTPERLSEELATARQAGRESEVTDLMMLAAHVSNDPWSSGDEYEAEVKAARNRQSQRRWQRANPGRPKKTRPGRRPKAGDVVRILPTGELWRVEHVTGACVYRNVGGKIEFCLMSQVQIVTEIETRAFGVVEAADAVDRAAWALVDATEPSPLRTALEAALEAYEAEADAVSATTA